MSGKEGYNGEHLPPIVCVCVSTNVLYNFLEYSERMEL